MIPSITTKWIGGPKSPRMPSSKKQENKQNSRENRVDLQITTIPSKPSHIHKIVYPSVPPLSLRTKEKNGVQCILQEPLLHSSACRNRKLPLLVNRRSFIGVQQWRRAMAIS